MQKIIERLTREIDGQRIPVILFSKGAGLWIRDIARTGCDAINVDSTKDIGEARGIVGNRVALQGNLDPAVLYESPEIIQQEVAKILKSFGKGNGHVFNLGHGISPDVNPDHVAIFVDTVHELSKPFHC